ERERLASYRRRPRRTRPPRGVPGARRAHCQRRFPGPTIDALSRRLEMKNAFLLTLAALLAPAVRAQGAPPPGSPDKPYVMEYDYKVQWGHQREFLDLFLKNHFPLLQKVAESGRILALRIETPANHMTEESRWDYRVTITYKNSLAATTAN